MKFRKMFLGFLMVCLLVAPVAVVAQPSLTLLWSQPCTGRVVVDSGIVECWTEAQPPAPTETPSAPTATPVPGVTETLAPTATLEPGATETPSVEPTITVTPTMPPMPTATPTPDPGVPLCTHDMRLWHDLFDETLGCRHDHEHGDDPNDGNTIFGLPGEWYGEPGTEVGGPFAPAGEMTEGHKVWKWFNHLNIPISFTEIRPPGGSYIRDLRVLTHVATGGPELPPAPGGLTHRFHGASVEANICQLTADRSDDPSSESCGIFRAGGVFDFGNLRTSDLDSGIIYLPEDGQMENLGLAGRRTHPTLDQISAGQWPGVVWYGKTWCAKSTDAILACVDLAAIVNDPWTYVIPGNASVEVGFIGDISEGFNGSNRDLHVAGVNLWNTSPTSLTWIGDQHGNPSATCTMLGQQDCGYVVVDGLPEVGHSQYASHGQNDREYDTSPPGQFWIGFPN